MTYRLDVLELTRTLLAFNTINPPGNEDRCARYIGELLSDAGFSVRYHAFAPGRTGLVAFCGGNGGTAPICLAGHLDTVPLGAHRWSREPFSGEIADGKLYGRGASDMKGGIAAMVVAAVELAERLDRTPGVSLVFVAGEETGCTGSAYLAGKPGELGRVGALVVGEPTGNVPAIGHKGAFWLEAVARGKTAHGSMPELGENAIYKAARAVLKLENFDFRVAPHPYLGAPSLNIGTIEGGMAVNSVPDRTAFSIDIRTIPGLDHGMLLKRLHRELGDEVTLERQVDVAGIWTDPSHPWIQSTVDILTPILGERPEVRTVPYFTDAGLLMPALGGIPTIILGPGEAGMAHQTDEYCRVDRLYQAVDAYRSICARWCGI